MNSMKSLYLPQSPMLGYLIVHETQDASEQSLESLVTHIKNFKLSSASGEDVTQAVSLIKSASRVLTFN